MAVFGCKKSSEKKIPVAGLNPYLELPYEGDETVTFYSDNSNLVTHVNKTTEQWPGWNGDTIYTSEIIKFDAAGYSPFFLRIDVGGTGNDRNIMLFDMFPDPGVAIGTGTQLPVDLANGNFVCDGIRNTFNDSLFLNNNVFYKVVELNLNGVYSGTLQIFYSRQYGVIGYSDKSGKIFAIRP